MPTADATLLPPPFVDGTATAEERDSVRHLEHVGAQSILGAMIEQKRRASQPSFSAIDLEAEIAAREADAAHDAEPTVERAPPSVSEVFVKAR